MDRSHVEGRVKAVRRWTAERWSDFRRQSRFFQAKATMVALYLLIVAATAVLAPPSAEPWVVKVGRIPFGISFKTFVEITNVDAGRAEDLVIEVAGTYTEFDNSVRRGLWKKKVASIPERTKLQLWPEDFKDLNGRSPAYTLVVEHLRILDGKDEILSVRPSNP